MYNAHIHTCMHKHTYIYTHVYIYMSVYVDDKMFLYMSKHTHTQKKV